MNSLDPGQKPNAIIKLASFLKKALFSNYLSKIQYSGKIRPLTGS